MKWIINSSFAAITTIASTSALSDTSLNAYQGKNGVAMLLESDGRRTFVISGGALPRGTATAADCLAKIKLTKNRPPNYFEGHLASTNNSISRLDRSDIDGKLGGLYVLKNKVRVGGIDTSGICPDGIDFYGNYAEINKNSLSYISTFIYFLDLISQDATNSLDEESNAIDEIKPFIDNKPKKCDNNPKCKSIFDSSHAVYMKLIDSNKHLSTKESVTK
ncbi:hypothetical protein [Ralstonia sp. A12]|uniref:hypothetical protein n=1 Tax=Ralstonia sp. A12 TaxID=1217052 RepID=UPI0012EEC4AB|nr:hypothetical protein [Ralstonia sp. A12]